MGYKDATRERLSETQLQPIEGYLDKLDEAVREGVGLYLYGDSSIGKTFIASVLCNEIDDRRTGMYSYMVTADELNEAWIEDDDDLPGSSLVFSCSDAQFLVIDDVGREYRANSGFFERRFGSLLRKRRQDNLTTIITSNLDPKEFCEIYGKGSAEIAKECMIVIHLKGPNVRDKIASEMARYFLEE